jgi:hypothetical protein
MAQSKKYLFIFIFVSAIFICATNFLLFLYNVSGCRPSNNNEFFISACGEPFVDYEHGAYFLGLEKPAIAALKNSEVLFLGSSRVQIAFSTNSTRNYFSEKNISYYLLGFGYVEQMLFSQSLLKKYDINPKVLVINADPFFQKYASPPAVSLLNDDWSAIKQYYFKKLAQYWIPDLCKLLPCKPQGQLIYRNSTNGEWVWWDTWRDPVAGHLKKIIPETVSSEQRQELINNMKEFMLGVKVPPECIILTFTPNDRFDLSNTNIELAKLFGFHAVMPSIPDIVIMDEDHFNLPTAERWSAAALEMLDPIIKNCLNKN